METETWSEFSNGGKAIAEQILASEEKYIQNNWTIGITVWDLSGKINHLSKVIWDYPRICKPVLMMDVKVSSDKNISEWVDRENLIYVR